MSNWDKNYFAEIAKGLDAIQREKIFHVVDDVLDNEYLDIDIIDVGDFCPRCKHGIIEQRHKVGDSCTCFCSAPCNHCMSWQLYCTKCDAESELPE